MRLPSTPATQSASAIAAEILFAGLREPQPPGKRLQWKARLDALKINVQLYCRFSKVRTNTCFLHALTLETCQTTRVSDCSGNPFLPGFESLSRLAKRLTLKRIIS